jgi:hypothetical protein
MNAYRDLCLLASIALAIEVCRCAAAGNRVVSAQQQIERMQTN